MLNLYKSWQFRQETFQLNGVLQQRGNVLLRSAAKFINESPWIAELELRPTMYTVLSDDNRTGSVCLIE